MSGGSLNYLYTKEPSNVFDWDYIDELELVEEELLKRGAKDIAKDVRRFIEYIRTAENRISLLQEQLSDIFHAVEWRLSGDFGEDDLQKSIQSYREEAET